MEERNIVSSDSHVIEPPEMWRQYIDPKFRDRAPHLEHGPENDFYVIEGQKPMDVTVLSSAGTPSEELSTWRRWDAPGRLRGGWDPDQRVKDQRTGFYVGNFQSVLDGNIDGFLDAYLRWNASGQAPAAVGDD